MAATQRPSAGFSAGHGDHHTRLWARDTCVALHRPSSPTHSGRTASVAPRRGWTCGDGIGLRTGARDTAGDACLGRRSPLEAVTAILVEDPHVPSARAPRVSMTRDM